MRIGILTLHRALNYGAVWQTYALKTSCEKLGNKVEVIDYNPFGHYTYKGFLKHRPDKALAYVRNFRFFNQFVDKYLNPTEHTESHEWITNNPPKDDVYIVGSDTVWCPDVVGDLINSYLMDFAPKNVKRISYAASFGGIFPNDDLIDSYRKELPKFSAISIREPQFIKETSELAGKEVVDVCDPSLLLTKDDYISLEKKKHCPKKYIVVFDLAGSEFVKESALKIKKELNLPIVNLTGKICSWADVNYFGLRAQEWIYLMHNAEFVCTNSFHGTAFAIIFEKPFYCCCVQHGGRSKTNGRVENLLNQVGLIDRYIKDVSDITSYKIDYDAVRSNITYYRERSFNWLKKALEL